MRSRPLIRMRGRLIACGGLLCALAAPAQAGSATSAFPVQITLANGAASPAGKTAAATFCVNQAFSQTAQATVTVVCSTNQFVSVQPFGASAFVGTDSPAYRFMLRPGMVVQPGDPAWLAGADTASTIQVIRKRKGKWEITGMQMKNGRWEITEIQINY